MAFLDKNRKSKSVGLINHRSNESNEKTVKHAITVKNKTKRKITLKKTKNL